MMQGIWWYFWMERSQKRVLRIHQLLLDATDLSIAVLLFISNRKRLMQFGVLLLHWEPSTLEAHGVSPEEQKTFDNISCESITIKCTPVKVVAIEFEARYLSPSLLFVFCSLLVMTKAKFVRSCLSSLDLVVWISFQIYFLILTFF